MIVGVPGPRKAPIGGVSKKKEIKKVALAEVGLDAGEVGAAGAQADVVKYHPLPERPPVKMIGGEAPEAAKELVKLLREEAKVI